jgi:hypothetical protein
VQLFHYHLVTSKVRLLEARYLGKLGFELIGRYGWRGESSHWFESGTSWEELDRMGFRLRLVELGRGAVNVVLHRARELGLKIQDHPGKRTFVTTEAGYRLEVHPPRDWVDDALAQAEELQIGELHLRAHDPEEKAVALSEILLLERDGTSVALGESIVRFLPAGPEGRPELVAEVLA